MSLAVFANFRIDTEERLQRMKDSFESFGESRIDQWVINARGKFGSDAVTFLNERIGKKLVSTLIDSNRGWFYDSRIMFNEINAEYVLFWIEDHICMCGSNNLNLVVHDMLIHKIEYLGYSWYGLGRFVDEFNTIEKNQTKNIYYFNYDKLSNKKRQVISRNIISSDSHIISACGIFSKDFFAKILFCKRPIFRRWPKETPFDFEKRSNDEYILPILYGIPKFEIFASIDDDNKHDGSSLFSRGLYPNRVSRSELVQLRNTNLSNGRFLSLRKAFKKIPFSPGIKDFLKRCTYHF